MGIIKAIARFFLSCLYSPDQSEAVFEQATSAYEQFLHPTDPNGVQLESHLNSAIALYREAVRLRRPNHPELGATLINLAAAIWSSYELSNKSQDKLNEVIELDKEALLLWKGRDPKPKDYPLLLTNLGMALLTGSNTESQASNKIDEAIDYLSAAYSLCDQCSYKSVTAKCVFHLASAHHTRFVQGSHSDEDLDATIKFFKATLELVPAGHKYRGPSLCHVSWALLRRYQKAGKKQDLDHAKDCARSARNFVDPNDEDSQQKLQKILEFDPSSEKVGSDAWSVRSFTLDVGYPSTTARVEEIQQPSAYTDLPEVINTKEEAPSRVPEAAVPTSARRSSKDARTTRSERKKSDR